MHCKAISHKSNKIASITIGKISEEFLSYKRVALEVGVETNFDIAKICESVGMAVRFAGGGNVIISKISGDLWKEYSQWRSKQDGIQDEDIAAEKTIIKSLFKFAEQRQFCSAENIPCFYRSPTEQEELARWVNSQSISWAAFTLKFPRFHNERIWNYVLPEFFIELERKYPKSTVKKHRIQNDEPLLQRLVFLGGDKEAGVVLHAQGLVEIQEAGIVKLQCDMQKIWESVVFRYRNYFCKNKIERQGKSNWLPEAKVWVEEFVAHEQLGASPHIGYLGRKEASDLGIGAKKVVLSATSLKPIRS